MKVQPEKTNSLKKILERSRTFDEAEYYLSTKVEMGGEDVKPEDEDEDENDDEEELPEEI